MPTEGTMSNSGLRLEPVRQETAPLRRKISSTLRQAIESGVLASGSRLVEKDLCAELNVSRTSLRESLRELEAEGLVSTGAKGLIVTAITPEDALNIYAVRGVLEALLAEQFARRASDPAMADLEAATDTLAAAYDDGSIERILGAKAEFYQVLCDGANNLVVLELLGRLNTRINRLRYTSLARPSRTSASMAEINELVAALKRKDIAGARAAALKHIDSAAAAALGVGYLEDMIEGIADE